MAHTDGDRASSYWAEVFVMLDAPILTDDGEIVRCYAVNLGIVCRPSQVREVIMDAISDGNIVWPKTTWRIFDRDAISDAIIKRRTDFELRHGVWYRSGKILLEE